jgi:hypothetical protein
MLLLISFTSEIVVMAIIIIIIIIIIITNAKTYLLECLATTDFFVNRGSLKILNSKINENKLGSVRIM